MKYLGLDAHCATSTVACRDHTGKLLLNRTFPTSECNLIETVRSIPGKKTLVVEESHLAAWVKRTLSAHVERLIVCDPKHNRWIAKGENANDKVDADKLAQLARGGFVREIYHPEGRGEWLRSLFLHYYDLNRQITRFKNKLKAEFRQRGIETAGAGIYNPANRDKWLSLLEQLPYVRLQVEQDFRSIDMLEEMKMATHAAMVTLARKDPGYTWLKEIPGAGPVVAAGYIALIDTPHRFSRKNKLWRYAGLSTTKQSSASIVYRDRATVSGCRPLKWLVTQQFYAAVHRSTTPNRFRKLYLKRVEKGSNSTTARRHVCRAILATVRAVWKKEEAYRDTA